MSGRPARRGMTVQDLVCTVLSIGCMVVAYLVLRRGLEWNPLGALIVAVPAGMIGFGILFLLVAGAVYLIGALCGGGKRKPDLPPTDGGG